MLSFKGANKERENMRREGMWNGSRAAGVQCVLLAGTWLEPVVMVPSRNRRATSRDNVASHSVSHAALSQATLFWGRASFRDSYTLRAARSISRQRRKRSAASLRRRLRDSGDWKI